MKLAVALGLIGSTRDEEWLVKFFRWKNMRNLWKRTKDRTVDEYFK